MAKVLMVSPNRWGRGITNIWIASHTATLKSHGHEVELFDATFYKNWTLDEIGFNTDNKMYQPSNYQEFVRFKDNDVFMDLQLAIDSFNPDLLFSGGISSHIHGEGEYVLPQYFNELLDGVSTEVPAIAGGLQPMSLKGEFFSYYQNVDGIFLGESEKSLSKLCDLIDKGFSFQEVSAEGLLKSGSKDLIYPAMHKSLDDVGKYDYSIFEEQVFFRAFQGEVVKAIDFEISRGCIYTCDYCVETVIQNFYGFEERSNKGALRDWRGYLRCKSAERSFAEFQELNSELGITLFRMQDTNFLTIDKTVLAKLAELFEQSGLNKKLKLYIETRPEGITEKSVKLLKSLGVVGVGMGVELSSQEFREDKLNRFANTEKVVRAFELLKAHGISRTDYNIIGLPDTSENDILETIAFNAKIRPDNITVAYFSPYTGTGQANKAVTMNMADPYEKDVDSALRPICRGDLTEEKLKYYKKHFVDLVNNPKEV